MKRKSVIAVCILTVLFLFYASCSTGNKKALDYSVYGADQVGLQLSINSLQQKLANNDTFEVSSKKLSFPSKKTKFGEKIIRWELETKIKESSEKIDWVIEFGIIDNSQSVYFYSLQLNSIDSKSESNVYDLSRTDHLYDNSPIVGAMGNLLGQVLSYSNFFGLLGNSMLFDLK